MNKYLQRALSAFGLVQKGSIAPFDKIPVLDGGIGDKLRNPFASSVWVQRAIKKVAGPIAAVPLFFEMATRRIEDPKLAAYWQAPARGLDRADFVEASVGWLKLAGEVFYLLDDTALVPFPEVNQRWPQVILARPDRMRHVVKGGELAGWEYRDKDGKGHALLPQQVIHLKFWNPYDEFRGLAELGAAMIAADADYLAGKYNLALMRNSGDRGPYIIAKGGMPTDEQREQIIAALRQKAHAAASGNFKPVFVTGDISVEDPKVQALDANVVAQRLHNRHEIFIAFGVPASMADVKASYSIGSASDRFILLEETCMPTGAKIASGISQVTQRLTGQAITAAFDWDEHSVMQEVRRERVDSAVKLWGMGMPMKSANEYLRLGMKDFKGWDTGYLPFSVQPVELAINPPEPAPEVPVAPPTDKPNAAEELKALFGARNPKPETRNPKQCGCCGEDAVGRSKAPYGPEFETRIRQKKSRIQRWLFEQRSRVLARLEKSQKAQAAGIATRAPFDDLFNNEEEQRLLQRALKSLLIADLEFGGAQLWREISQVADFKLPPQISASFWTDRAAMMADVSDNVTESVLSTLRQGLEAGDTFDQLADRIRADYNELSQFKAEQIAQTETQVAINTGRMEGMKMAGVERKEWHTSNLANVRATHLASEERSQGGIPIDQPFANGLMFPGDPNGPPEEVINCRCYMVAVLTQDNA